MKNKQLNLGLSLMITCCLGGLCLYQGIGKEDSKIQQSQVTKAKKEREAYLQKDPVVSVVKKSISAVVSISCSSKTKQILNPFSDDPFFSFFFGGTGQTRVQTSSGSGVIISPEGYVATCAHVVSQADKIKVTLSNNVSFQAEVVAMDESLDLAILKLNLKGRDLQLPYLNLLDDPLEVGESVVAIGNSFGVGQTVTHGIISAVLRVFQGHVFHQTDAPINPGNSGGPIITLSGEIAGLSSAIATRSGASHGVGFLIPAWAVRYMLNCAIHKRQEGYLPLKVQTADSSIIENLCEKGANITGGVVVAESQYPQLQPGDMILSFAGQSIHCKEIFEFLVKLSSVGDNCVLTYIKGADIASNSLPKPITIAITIEKRKELEDSVKDQIQLSGDHFLDGVVIANLPQEMSQQIEGVLVLKAPKSSTNVQKGDIIRELNGIHIKDTQDVVKALSQKQRGFSITVQRGHSTLSQSYNF